MIGYHVPVKRCVYGKNILDWLYDYAISLDMKTDLREEEGYYAWYFWKGEKPTEWKRVPPAVFMRVKEV